MSEKQYVIREVEIINFNENKEEISEYWSAVCNKEIVEQCFEVRNIDTAENLCDVLNKLYSAWEFEKQNSYSCSTELKQVRKENEQLRQQVKSLKRKNKYLNEALEVC